MEDDIDSAKDNRSEGNPQRCGEGTAKLESTRDHPAEDEGAIKNVPQISQIDHLFGTFVAGMAAGLRLTCLIASH